MTLVQKLDEFTGAVGAAAAHAPDDYPDWGYVTYESNMTEIRECWAEILPLIKRDLDQAELIHAKLKEALSAFAAGEKDVGQNAMWAIYNLKPTKLR